MLSFASLAALTPRDSRYLFLLSHMRSYSSLLSHLLGSSPDIDGYGEMHVRYRSQLSLLALRWKVQHSIDAPLQGQWLLDKILHNKIRAPWRLLSAERCSVVIFLRPPEATLRSLLAMKPTRPGERAWNDQRACDYYVTRLHRLRSDGEMLCARALYMDADALMNNAPRVLQRLGQWLGLSQPLTPNYQLFPRTGETRIGDPSGSILAGVIDPERTQRHPERIIDKSVLKEATAAYLRCRAILMRQCTTNSDLLSADPVAGVFPTAASRSFVQS
ncbi:MAG: hypothetical protein QM718_09095 [Steroidobacteraceae bacterium]